MCFADQWHSSGTWHSTWLRPKNSFMSEKFSETSGPNWNTKSMVSKAPLCRVYSWPIGQVMGDSESFNWCFMGSVALCAVLQDNCNIPLRTDLESICDYSSWHLKVFLWGLFQSLTSVLCVLVGIYMMTPNFFSLCLPYKTFTKSLWKCLLFCLLFVRAKAG